MSIFPIFNAFFAGLLIWRFFNWNVWVLIFSLFCAVLSVLLYVQESSMISFHYESGFWLFIFREVIIFGTLLFCCLYFDYDYYINLSSSLELPFLGCFVLLGSSVTVTGFHHLLYWDYSWVLLLLTIILGLSFVFLQISEMEEIIVNLFDTSFHARSLCTVGLHFSHVLLGVVALFTLFFFGYKSFGYYRCSIVTWYWHFVDYVWLFVYTFVYICYYW